MAPARETMQTPPPPARSRQQTPPPPTNLQPGGGADAPRPTPRSHAVPQGASRGPQSRPHNLPPSQRDQQPRPATSSPSGNYPTAPTAQAGQQAPAGARASGPRPAVPPETPAYGVQRPSPAAFATGRQSQPQFAAQSAAPLAYNASRVHHHTARIPMRSRARWPKVLLTMIVLLGGAAAVVHLFVVPLDVLATWRSPARLSITTQPTGATLKLDGVPLAGTAPTTVSVWRDRGQHVIEASVPGFETTRDNVRYDKSVALSVQMYLAKDKAAAPTPPPTPAPTDAPP